jgi:uncharacterized protein (UPF0332 family)
MGLTNENRNDIVTYRIERAYMALEQAKSNLQMGYLEITANRLYYAAYYAASALLIAHEIRVKSHEGCIGQFNLNFVKTGLVPIEMGKLFSTLFDMRITGDYSDRFDLTENDVIPNIRPTEDFINKVTKMAKEKLQIM